MSCRIPNHVENRHDPASSSFSQPCSTGYPFGVAQGGESFDVAQDREPVERPAEPRIESGMTDSV
jgi:hypothetical protein